MSVSEVNKQSKRAEQARLGSKNREQKQTMCCFYLRNGRRNCRSLIAVFNRAAWRLGRPPSKKKKDRCNSFLAAKKDNKGHPRDGGGRVYVSCRVSRVPLENYDERLYIQASKPRHDEL